MDCPKGQVYWTKGKRCIYPEALPGLKGKSRSACPSGKVWLSSARKCILKNVYEKHYGKAELAKAIKKQKAIGQRSIKQRSIKQRSIKLGKITRKKPKSPKAKTFRAPIKPRSITPKKAIPVVGVTPAFRKTIKLSTTKPKKDSFMPPGLSTKKDMISWVSQKCTNQQDSISLEPFDELPATDLKTMVRLSNNYCYLADDLDKHVKTSVERDVPIKDIANPWYRLDAADLGALEYQGKAKNKNYRLPTKVTEFPAEHYKLFIDVVDESPFKFIFLYDERKIKIVNDGMNYSPAIPKGGFLGYIPEQGSEKLTSLIKKAYASGRIFTKAVRPFECCRFHLKKSKDYWAVDMERKIKAMEEEIEEFI
jgi:hypothetical protein